MQRSEAREISPLLFYSRPVKKPFYKDAAETITENCVHRSRQQYKMATWYLQDTAAEAVGKEVSGDEKITTYYSTNYRRRRNPKGVACCCSSWNVNRKGANPLSEYFKNKNQCMRYKAKLPKRCEAGNRAPHTKGLKRMLFMLVSFRDYESKRYSPKSNRKVTQRINGESRCRQH